MVYFTPNATTLNGHEHVTISAITPTTIVRRNRNDARTGRRETTLYIPHNFTGKFIINITTDYPKRRKNAARLHRLGVTVEKGVIIGVTNLSNDRLPYVEVSFPSGYWGSWGRIGQRLTGRSGLTSQQDGTTNSRPVRQLRYRDIPELSK